MHTFIYMSTSQFFLGLNIQCIPLYVTKAKAKCTTMHRRPLACGAQFVIFAVRGNFVPFPAMPPVHALITSCLPLQHARGLRAEGAKTAKCKGCIRTLEGG